MFYNGLSKEKLDRCGGSQNLYDGVEHLLWNTFEKKYSDDRSNRNAREHHQIKLHGFYRH